MRLSILWFRKVFDFMTVSDIDKRTAKSILPYTCYVNRGRRRRYANFEFRCVSPYKVGKSVCIPVYKFIIIFFTKSVSPRRGVASACCAGQIGYRTSNIHLVSRMT
jgi:hypothetical protein